MKQPRKQAQRTGDVCRWLAAVLAVALMGCSGTGDKQTPEAGGTLRVAVFERFDFPTPIRPPGRATLEFLNHITPPLGWVDAQGRVRPRAARDWLERENIWDFYLSDLVWEDGAPLRPEDFRATWQASLHPTLRAEWGGRYDFIQNVRAYSDTTLRITWHLLPPHRYRAAMFLPLPTHLLGDDLDVRNYRDWPTTRQPMACGPFRMPESSGHHMLLARNPTWTRRPAWLDSVRVTWMQEPEAVQAFRDGQLDVLDGVSTEAVDVLRQVEGAHTFAVVGRSYTFMGWNLQDNRAADVTVRRAAAYAVDLQRLIDDHTLGQGEPSRGPLLPIQGFADTTRTFTWDPDVARRLLRDAGWSDSNANGILDRRGVNLHFEILVAEEKSLHRQLAQAVAQQLRDVGYGITVHPLPTLQLLDRLNAGAFEAYIGQWYPDLDGNVEDVWSTGVLQQFNYGGYASARADSLMGALRYELRGYAREALFHDLQRTIYDDQPYLFLVQPPRFTVLSSRVRGADPNVLSTFWNLPHWWIPRSAQ